VNCAAILEVIFTDNGDHDGRAKAAKATKSAKSRQENRTRQAEYSCVKPFGLRVSLFVVFAIFQIFAPLTFVVTPSSSAFDVPPWIPIQSQLMNISGRFGFVFSGLTGLVRSEARRT
jgi:hypothetical protein